ncbi:MAG: VanW family protein [Candidatus Uhrbacteria bacterium GW2011_GWD2_52_7]|uniref:VanW family protein n=1 Tax=Candidatus Uhrbacteria bacterium GW2011_GWD2_52_7 TaxID=1618989 RepID=A0A0G1XID1_9BACT|nr:MAG: VanW family protein [Candidatus Uhrbacteria bacterium GW2011_GWD2_52_7]
MTESTTNLAPTVTTRNWRVILLPVGIIAVILAALIATTLIVQAKYDGRILPNVHVAGVELSGLNEASATERLQSLFDDMVADGLVIDVNDDIQTIELYPSTGQGGDIAYSLMDFDTAAAAKEAISTGRSESALMNALGSLYYATIGRKNIPATVTIDESRLGEAIRAAFPDIEVQAVPTDFVVTFSRNIPTVTATDGIAGLTYDIAAAAQAIRDDANDLSLETITVTLVSDEPDISTSEATTLIAQATSIIEAAPYTVAATLSGGEAKTWTVKSQDIAEWIIPARDTEGKLTVLLDANTMVEFLEGLHDALDIAPQNARFKIEEDRVVEFAGSASGSSVDDQAFFDAFENALGNAESTVTVSMRIEEPSVTTENVNNLGIKDILGVGTSSYKGSPTNRRANIKHGAEKLNGLLIAPGETVSLLEQLRPFTTADGYFPELVIKGDEIKPEIGGGLCQIGTTTFRAVMNSGLEVVERRNHSLVVSYYNDPSNNNPGTDATIYDPSPDFKFKNDTANYILLVAEVDETRSGERQTVARDRTNLHKFSRGADTAHQSTRKQHHSPQEKPSVSPLTRVQPPHSRTRLNTQTAQRKTSNSLRPTDRCQKFVL